MRYRKLLITIIVFSCMLSGCRKEELEVETAPAFETAEEKYAVDRFKGNEESSYSLYIDGEKKDITDYVIECNGNSVVFNSALLSQIGFSEVEKTEDGQESAVPQETIEALKDYEYRAFLSPDGTMLQCRMGGNKVFYGTDSITLQTRMDLLEDGNFQLPIEAFLAMGYNEIETSRDGNTVTFRLLKN